VVKNESAGAVLSFELRLSDLVSSSISEVVMMIDEKQKQ
jgi:hypothetical protein